MGAASSVVNAVTDTASNVVDSITSNPEAAILDVAAIATGNPELIPAINGANAIAKGASPEQVALSAGASYLAGQVAPDVGSSVAADTGSSALGNVAQSATQGAIGAGLRGGDPLTGAATGALTSGINQGISYISDELQNQGDSGYADACQPTACGTSDIGAKLAQTFLTPGLVGSVMGSQNAAHARTPAQRSALGAVFGPGCTSMPWLDTKAQMLAGILPPEDEIPMGGLDGLAGAIPDAQVPPIYGEPIAGMTPELMSVIQDRGIDLTMASGGPVQNFACGSSATTYCSTWGPMGQYAPKFYPVKCNMLVSQPSKKAPMALAGLKQLQSHIASGGNMGGMAKGGLPAKYEEAAPEGHHPEFITGITGYYAGGRGTGQSDDIPAMLHDGDYVIDAEAVSALGDGSSKAGNEALMHFMHQIPHSKDSGGKPVPAKIADGEVVLPESFVTALGDGDNKRGARMLDEMRQRLREHKRSAPNSKIPPKAKTPLEYLRGAKG
jgi:hypothetical protein